MQKKQQTSENQLWVNVPNGQTEKSKHIQNNKTWNFTHTPGTQCTCRSSQRCLWPQWRSTRTRWTLDLGTYSCQWRREPCGFTQGQTLVKQKTCKKTCKVSIVVVLKVTLHQYSPVIVFKPWPPVWCTQESLNGTGQVNKQVAHQEEPTVNNNNTIKSSSTTTTRSQ